MTKVLAVWFLPVQSHPQHRGRPSNLSLQGLSQWQPAENHDLIGRRVHPSLPVACLARGLSPHSLLWVSRQPLSQRKTRTVSSAAGNGTAGTRLPHRGARTGLSRPLPGSYGFFPVGMPRWILPAVISEIPKFPKNGTRWMRHRQCWPST